jgi:hypothetical protein
MAKQPKSVHQMTEAQFESAFPADDEDACKRIWSLADGPKASFARAVP